MTDKYIYIYVQKCIGLFQVIYETLIEWQHYTSVYSNLVKVVTPSRNPINETTELNAKEKKRSDLNVNGKQNGGSALLLTNVLLALLTRTGLYKPFLSLSLALF